MATASVMARRDANHLWSRRNEFPRHQDGEKRPSPSPEYMIHAITIACAPSSSDGRSAVLWCESPIAPASPKLAVRTRLNQLLFLYAKTMARSRVWNRAIRAATWRGCRVLTHPDAEMNNTTGQSTP